uniref:Glycine N-acyltransferase-like protein n=1 Tax=Acanthochromis polyacanthus TaxID=80966 RepID=A0A3Q1E903_9TELE
MKVLDKDELQVAEQVLLQHLPKSYKVYGFIHVINRNKPTTQQVVVDSWPDFKVIICRPDLMVSSCPTGQLDTLFTALSGWSFSCNGGRFDFSHAPLLKEVSSDRKLNNSVSTLVHLLHLPDINYLLPPAVDSELESRVSSLNLSHVDLVNKTWKYGGNERSYRNIKNLISNFPSGCITDGQGEPVSWILMYDYCAMGMLYTLPEHRGKGHAKVLVSTMAKKLHAEGYPVYSFIEEDNMISYKLFKNLGFIEDASYRAAWFEFLI